MRACLTAALACLLSLPVIAQDEAPLDCKVHAGQQWQSLGSTSMMACLEGIEQTVGQYNAQGFKFGMWGATMLSTDRNYFYRSPDGGKSWQALGLQSQLVAAPPADLPAETAREPEDVLTAVQEDAAAQAPALEFDPSLDTDSSVPYTAPPAETAAVQPPQLSAAQSLDRRSCSLGTSGNWDQVGILTLRECAEALDRAPDDFDSLGFKYGYWSGIFLAANRREVLSSTDSRSWQPLILRAVP